MIDNDFINTLRASVADMIPVGEGEIFAFKSAWPVSDISSYPAVIVMPSENNTDYGTTYENRVSIVFELQVYYPLDEAEPEKTERAVGKAVGELLSIFSQKAGVPGTIITRPVPSVWGDTTIGPKPYRTATVILTCVTYPLVG